MCSAGSDDDWVMSTSIGIYTRLSHDATGEQTATARQERACRSFAELRGWTVAEVFEDVDVSAYKTGVIRPAYERLLLAVRSGDLGGVLVWKLDRLVRRPAEFERFWSACEEQGAIVASATEPIDTSHELGLAIVRILVTFASLESATQSLRLKAKHREMAERGHALNGPPPYGWRAGMRELEPGEANLLREAADRVLGGETLSAVVADWHARGVRNRVGRAFQISTIRRMLQAPKVVGDRVHYGEVVARDCRPAILDRRQWAELRVLLADHSTRQSTPGSVHLLTGFLRCGRCGARMHGRKKSWGSDYACPRADCGGCGSANISGRHLEPWLLERVFEQLESAPADFASLHRPSVSEDQLTDMLEEHASALERLSRRRFVDAELTRAGYLAAGLALSESFHQRTNTLAPNPLTLLSVDKDPRAIRGRWSALTLRERKAIIGQTLHYAVVYPVGNVGAVFHPERVEPVWWGSPPPRPRRVDPPRRRKASARTRQIAQQSRRRNRTWTDRQLVAALRAWVESTDDPSSSQYRLEALYNPYLPSLSTISKRLGGWATAVRRVSGQQRPPAWRRRTNEEILELLREWLRTGGDGRVESYNAISAHNRDYPSTGTILARFGSWHQAVAAAGFRSAGRRWGTRDTQAAIDEWLDAHPAGDFNTYRRAAKGNPDLPSPQTLTARLGGWRSIVRTHDLGPIYSSGGLGSG
ncbi:MAG: hypothetical protein QOI95_89 [Acidimicrobiaceae bacterium]|jgi:DNA invertase Pin-like site-specific DNA recombinase